VSRTYLGRFTVGVDALEWHSNPSSRGLPADPYRRLVRLDAASHAHAKIAVAQITGIAAVLQWFRKIDESVAYIAYAPR
jgi:hypothetical protein